MRPLHPTCLVSGTTPVRPLISLGAPTPDRSFALKDHVTIPNWVSRPAIQRFEESLQAQGPHDGRLPAIDQAVSRVRGDRNVTGGGFRLFHTISEKSKGKALCCGLDLDIIAYLAGLPDRAAASRLLKDVEASEAIDVLRFSEPGPPLSPPVRRLCGSAHQG